MSLFVDELNKISRGNPQPMGFGRGQASQPRPRIMLICALSPRSAAKAAGMAAGADAAVVRAGLGKATDKAFKQCASVLPDIPWGLWLDGYQASETIGLNYDFVVFPAQGTPLGALGERQTGRLLEVTTSLNDGLLRTVNEIGVDGLLLGCPTDVPLTWQYLMQIQHVAQLVAKPLLVMVPPTVTAAELKQLWEAGVDGVIIDLTAAESGGDIKRLREAIDGMSFTSPRRRHRIKAMLPATNLEAEIAAKSDDEEDI